MSRPLRIQYPGAVYHIMNRGRARQPTFVDETDYRAFLETLAEAHRQWGIEMFAYCLMGNHYHLCLRTPMGNLSRIMRHVDGIYTQRFNRRHRRDGTLFRGRYKGILIDADEYLAAVVRYIHLNAVEAGLVKMPEEYRWASHQFYLKAKGTPGWLDTKEAIEQIFIGIDEDGLIAAPKQCPIAPMAPVESLGIDSIDVAHDPGEVSVRSSKTQMIVISHQGVGKHLHAP